MRLKASLFKFFFIVIFNVFVISQGYSASLQEGLNAFNQRDYKKAKEILEPLALQGHTKAQFTLAEMYSLGKGFEKDDKKEFSWLKMAAEGGHVDAQFAIF
jgi:TPR repeat protein